MSKYRISVSIDGENYFWIVVDKEKLIRNPTIDDLKGTKLIYYNKTNICPMCREENIVTDRSMLYPKNALRETDKNGKKTDKWVCNMHGSIYYSMYAPNSRNNVIKSLRDRRTGNLNNPYLIFADNCEELTCRCMEVKNLNKEDDNYKSPIDHSRDPELGIAQTKGAHFSRDFGGWQAVYGIIEHRKKYDFMIIWCASIDGKIIERGYIIPKDEINKRRIIRIIKNPSRHEPWYEEYRIKDDDEMNRINEIWSKILEEDENNR